MLSFSIAVVNKVEIGLDQKLSMPDVSPNALKTAHTLAKNYNQAMDHNVCAYRYNFQC